MLRKFLIILTIVGFFVGLGIFLYPQISSWLISNDIKTTINEFKATEISSQPKESDPLYQEMYQYNQNLYLTGQSDISDAWTFEQEEFTLNNYDYKNDVIATITIPKMNLELPIYLGATKENMAKGIVNLGNTSLPIGGKNSNCVLAGHRGYQGAPFFRDIEDLEIGDKIIIQNFWEQLEYNVSKIKVIYPSESKQILIQDDKDMITLLTCHPYRHNYQRYVVYCVRSDEFDGNITDNKDTKIISSKKEIAIEQNLPYVMIGILGIIVIITFIYCKKKTNKNIAR